MTRVLNPIVSESYMKGYIKDEGLIKPEGKITITENGTDIDVAQFRTADVAVSSGGGGSIENPVLTITFNNTMSGEAGQPYYYTIDNNQLIKMFKALPGNTETVFNTIVPIYRSEDEEDFAGWECDSLASVLGTITASNEVNCSLDYTANTVCRIWLDDPTEDASITLTFTNP